MEKQCQFDQLFSDALCAARFVLGSEFASRAPEIAQDVVCNVMLHFERNSSRTCRPRNLRHYVFKASRNAALKYAQNTTRFISLDSASNIADPDNYSTIPFHSLERKEQGQALIALLTMLYSPVLEALSPQEYTMVQWWVWENRAPQEIALLKHSTTIAVRQQCCRLLRKIHRMLLEEIAKRKLPIFRELAFEVLFDRGQMNGLLKLVWIQKTEGEESLLSAIDLTQSKLYSSWL